MALSPDSLNDLGLRRIERPPLLWDAAGDEEALRLLIEAMVRATGTDPSALVLGLSNVEIARDSSDEHLPEGAYVGVTLRGEGSWASDALWSPALPVSPGILGRVHEAMLRAAAASAYSRSLPDGSSVTVLVPRA